MKLNFILFCLFSTFLGCSSFKKIVEPPKVKLENVKVANLAGLYADLEVVLEVENPNKIDFDVKSLKYALDVNSKTITSGVMQEKVVVKGKQKTLVSLPIRVQYKDILGSALLLFKQAGLPYKVKGSVEVGPFTIPFDDEGNLKKSDL
jgi:LEA14-like dessication related protein